MVSRYDRTPRLPPGWDGARRWKQADCAPVAEGRTNRRSVAIEGADCRGNNSERWHVGVRPGEDFVQHLPFEPTRAVVDAGGCVWWAGTRGGIWQGIPPAVLELRADAPPWLWVEATTSEVLFHPFFRDETGQPWRVGCRTAWRLPRGTGEAALQPLGPFGQCGDVAVSPSWTARAYPYADLIRLTPADPAAAALDLACYFPRTLAWAGTSLYVGSPDDRALLASPRRPSRPPLYGAKGHRCGVAQGNYR